MEQSLAGSSSSSSSWLLISSLIAIGSAFYVVRHVFNPNGNNDGDEGNKPPNAVRVDGFNANLGFGINRSFRAGLDLVYARFRPISVAPRTLVITGAADTDQIITGTADTQVISGVDSSDSSSGGC